MTVDPILTAIFDRYPNALLVFLWVLSAGLGVWLGILLGRFQRDARELRLSCDALRACHLRVEAEVDVAKLAALQLRQDHEVLKAQHGATRERIDSVEDALCDRINRVEVVLGGPPRVR